MPGFTTPDSIAYPVTGDKMSPLAPWFALLASSVQTAITNLRSSLSLPPVPAPLSSQGPSDQSVSSTSWANVPNSPAITLTLERACWVQISQSAWMISSTGDVRVSSTVSGATTLAENQLEVGGPATAWGQVLYKASSASTDQQSGTRTVRLNAGTNTIQMRAYIVGAGGTRKVNYSTLQVVPLRWA